MNFIAWNKLQVKHKVSVFVISTAIITYLLYDLVLLPQWAHIDELTAEQSTELQKVKVIENYVLAHPSPEQHLVELDNKMLQIDKAFPDNPDISSFLVQIEQLSQECGVQLAYLKPGKIDNKEGYRQLDIELSINGSFAHVMDFLNKMENGLRFVNVTNIALQLGKEGLTSKLSAKIYSYGLPTAPVATNNKVPDAKK